MTFYGVKDFYLRNYRNMKTLDINSDQLRVIILGNNGSGKTNILEAISLLSPARPMRGAKFDEMCNNESSYFEAGFNICANMGFSRVAISFDKSSSKKNIELNEKKIPNHELAKLCSIIWLTPQMEWIFIGPSSDRRRFFDRIVYLFDHQHASRINKYEYYLKERMKILQLPSNNTEWLNIIESKLSEVALAIINKRTEIIKLLQDSLDSLESPFPKARITISENNKYNDVNMIIDQFRLSRENDKASGRNSFGPHKDDFIVFYNAKNIQAKFCSTGEQKAMLISITIAQILALKKFTNNNPILLLDEVFVHLDNQRREYLADFLNKYESQFWVTSTEEEVMQFFPNSLVIRI